MTVITWAPSRGTFDWSDAANWQGGVLPGTEDIARIWGSSGSSHVEVTSAVAVREVQMNALHTILVETSTGSITANTLDLVAGTMELGAANNFGPVTITDGTSIVQISADGALGRKPVSDQGGMIDATADTTFRNALTLHEDGDLAASAGHTLLLEGAFTATAPVQDQAVQIWFGNSGIIYNQTVATGTVELAGKSFTLAAPAEWIEIKSGTVTSASGGHSVEANEMFNQAAQVTLDAGATLNTGNFGTSVTLHDLTGAGTLESARYNTHIAGADFAGTFATGARIIADGTNVLTGNAGARFIMGAGTDSLDLSSMKSAFTLSAPSGSSATVIIGEGASHAHFLDFQAGHLTIDTVFADTDSVRYLDSAGRVQMVINHGPGGAMPTSLYFYGISTPGDIVVGNDGHGHLEFTYNTAPGEAHAQHDAAVASATAEAAFVPPSHDLF